MKFTCLNIEYMHFCRYQWKWATNFIFQKNWLWKLKKKCKALYVNVFVFFIKLSYRSKESSFLNKPPTLPHLAELCFNFDDSLECQITFVSGRLLVFEKKVAMCFSSSIKTKAPHFDQFYQILPKKRTMGYSRKNPNWEGWGYTFLNPPQIFHFLNLPLEIPDKPKLKPWIFHKFVLDPLEVPRRPKTKTPRNSTLFFLGNSWKFVFVFN